LSNRMFRKGLFRVPRRLYSKAEKRKIDEDISKYFQTMSVLNSDGSERIPFIQGVSKINSKPSWLGTDEQMMKAKEKNAKEEVKAPLTLHTEPLDYTANMGVEDLLKYIYTVATEHEYIRPTAKIRFTAKYRLETERPKVRQRYENLDLYSPLEYVIRKGKDEIFTVRPETHHLIQPNLLICCSEAEEKILSSKNATYIGGKAMVQKVALENLPLDFALVTRTAKDAMMDNDFFTEYCAKLNIPLPELVNKRKDIYNEYLIETGDWGIIDKFKCPVVKRTDLGVYETEFAVFGQGWETIEKNFAVVEHYFTNVIAMKMGGSGGRGIELDFEYAQFEIDDMFENRFLVPTVRGETQFMHNEDFEE